MEQNVEFAELKGKVLESVVISANKDKIIFRCNDASVYEMWHQQDCCESVWIEDIAGGCLEDIVGQKILDAYVTSRQATEQERMAQEYCDGSATWTFYTIRTLHYTITIRWFGTSNGYYSESVNFYLVKSLDSNYLDIALQEKIEAQFWEYDYRCKNFKNKTSEEHFKDVVLEMMNELEVFPRID